MSLALPVDIYLCVEPTDMRKSFDGLWALAVEHLGRDPFRGGLFVFINKRRDRMKLLYWDADGIAVWAKKQETECHRNLVFTGSWGSPHNSGISADGAGRVVSKASEPSPRRRPMPYDTEVPVPPRAACRRRRWRSINSGFG